MLVMRIKMKKENIYLLGIFGLGLIYPLIEKLFGGGAFFVAAMLSIILFLAWIAGRFGK